MHLFDWLGNFFKGKDKKTLSNIAFMLVVGLVLLVLSVTLFNDGGGGGSPPAPQDTLTTETTPESETSYESALEARLEESLSLVEGAGSVKVMVTLSYGKEKIIAENGTAESASTTETDSQGGSRQSNTQSSQSSYVIITEKDGSQTPLVVKEIQPKIEGVIIVAEGGGDIHVIDALTRAAYTVLGIEPHKVQVLKMQGTSQTRQK